MKGDWSSGMIPASGAGGRGFDSRITPSFLFFGRLPRPSKPLDEPGQHRCVVATCLVSSVRQSVRLLIDWPRVRSPHGVLLFFFFFLAFSFVLFFF